VPGVYAATATANAGWSMHLVALVPAVVTSSGGVVVNFNDIHQRIDGFGAADAFVRTLTDAEADLFFSPSLGIGLSMLRVGISSTGGDLSSYANATKAAARGARVWAAPWSAPGAWKDNGTTTGGGHLLASHYDDWATVLANFANNLQLNAGVTLSGLSVQNEPDFTASYDSMVYTPDEMASFVKVLGPKLAALNPRPVLMLPEVSNWSGAWDYTSAVLADGTAASYLDVIAAHQYVGVSAPQTAARPIWETEMSSFEPFDPGIANGLRVARWIHDAIVVGNVSAWHYWWLKGSNGDNEGLMEGRQNPLITKRLYTLGNFSKFVRPGFVVVGASGLLPDGVSLTSFKDPATGGFVIVAINETGVDLPLTVTLNGAGAASVTPWVTSSSLDLSAQLPIPVSNGSFTVTLAASSVTSFVASGGQ